MLSKAISSTLREGKKEQGLHTHTFLVLIILFIVCLPPLETYLYKGKTFHLFCSLLHPQCLEQLLRDEG